MIRRQADMRIQTREDMRGGKGTVTLRHYFEADEIGADVRLCAQVTLPPGAGIGSHIHENEDELFIIHSGQGVVEEGSSEIEVSAGDVTLTRHGEAHAIRNTGNTDLVFTGIITCYAK